MRVAKRAAKNARDDYHNLTPRQLLALRCMMEQQWAEGRLKSAIRRCNWAVPLTEIDAYKIERTTI